MSSAAMFWLGVLTACAILALAYAEGYVEERIRHWWKNRK